MPRAKSGRRSGRRYTRPSKKTYKAKRRYSRRKPTFNRTLQQGGAFPKQRIVKLKYCDYTNIGVSTLGYSRTMRANSVFDPDYAAGGHQPLGHDQWSAFYHRYQVIGSKLTMKVSCGNGANNNDSTLWYSRVSDVPAPSAPTLTEVMEGNKFRHMIIQGNTQIGKPRVLTNKFSLKQYYGFKDNEDNTLTTGLCASSDPGREAYFVFGYTPQGGATITGSAQLWMTVEYIVRYFDPVDLVTS